MKLILVALVFILTEALYAQDFTIVFLNKKADKAELPEAEVKQLMDGHMANMARLAKENKLWAAGPFDGGGGIFIFKTGSKADVQEWIKTDPAVQANRWNLEIFPYVPRSGSVCAVGEKFEMTNYFFVRYSVAKPGDSKSTPLHLEFVDAWKTGGAIIAEAGLGDGQGSVLVTKEEPTTEKLASDPAVKSGALTMTVKKLFIAKGSFCEPK